MCTYIYGCLIDLVSRTKKGKGFLVSKRLFSLSPKRDCAARISKGSLKGETQAYVFSCLLHENCFFA